MPGKVSSAEPLSIPPSLYWDGDDGRWSTFHIQVGTPPQTLRVLPGTSASAGSVPWVIMNLGCSAVNPNLPNCVDRRGGLFYSNDSETWSTEGLQNGADGAIYSLNTFAESLLNRQGNGSYGYDAITLGLNGNGLPTLESQLLATIWTNDFWTGSLGLSPYSFNFTDFQDPQPSILSTLYNRSLIPSRSWAYTAGAHYQSSQAFGSLTLGGYDASRFRQNNFSFPFGADFSRDLLVGLRSITYDTEGSVPLLNSRNSIDIFIDSMVPEIWLPLDVCKQFEERFNLTFHEGGQLYTVKADAHRAMLAQNPAFTFTLSQPGRQGPANETLEIVLPYAAFDMNLTAPIVGNDTRWFPLKQAQNESQYTLGRTFLQEAYVIADYERKNFSVSQALFPSTSVQQNLVAIHAPDSTESATGQLMSTGTVAGIIVAVAAVLCICGLATWICMRRRRKQAKAGDAPGDFFGDDKSKLSAIEEMDSSETAVQEADDGHLMKPELSAGRGVDGRHELETKEDAKEIAASVVPVELEAPSR